MQKRRTGLVMLMKQLAKMIDIESNIPIKFVSKYNEYIDAWLDMNNGESFVVKEKGVVEGLRGYVHRKETKSKLSYRTLTKGRYRIWKLNRNK